jgi:hypothetical protein
MVAPQAAAAFSVQTVTMTAMMQLTKYSKRKYCHVQVAIIHAV